mgnify:CR=1 FL=1
MLANPLTNRLPKSLAYRMDILKKTVREEVEKYAAGGRGANILLFAILDDERGIYAVNAVDYPICDNLICL